MHYRSSIGTIVLTAAALGMPTATQAFDDAIYPALTGQWTRASVSGDCRPAPIRSEQAARPRTTGPADTRVPGEV